MFAIQIVNHKNINSAVLERIISLKQKAWPYPKDSQMGWIRDNLRDGDLHVILLHDGEDVAYLNLCDVHCEINGVEKQCMGIGNVCSAVKGMGYGNRLMTMTNEWLKSNEKIGLLFCHSHVELFYAKCGWNKLDENIYDIEGVTPEILVYIYNASNPVLSLKYKDRLF